MSGKTPRLPPFKAIEAFMAAAQALSFTEAAAMLYVTVPAISRRIQALETELGVKLFLRMHHGLVLTEAGEAYAARLAPALKQIRDAGEVVRTSPRPQALRINVLRSFAAHWLMPRLPAFHARHPEIELELDSTGKIVRDDWHGIDLAIGFGRREDWLGLHCDRLIDPTIYPVCSPALRAAGGMLSGADDGRSPILLDCKQVPDGWLEWLRSVGRDPVGPGQRRLVYDDLQLLYEAAAGSLGIAIGIDTVVQRYLQDGRLVVAHGHRVRCSRSYFVICRPGGLDNPAVLAFRRWLLAEVALPPVPRQAVM